MGICFGSSKSERQSWPDGNRSMDAPLIALRAVSYAYSTQDRLALREIDLTVEKGELVGIIGQSGAGKSTLCKLLNGIVPQFYGGHFWGDAHVAGMDLAESPIAAISSLVGSVFQDPETQLVCSTVEQEVAFVLENLKTPSAGIASRVDWALGAVGLAGLEQRHPSELSGGQQQRLAIAAVLAVKPQLLVLDEPTSQLDPLARREIFELLACLNQSDGITVVVASHAMEELAGFASRILLLDHGQIVSDGTPGEILTDCDLLLSRNLKPPEIVEIVDDVFSDGITNQPQICTLEGAIGLFSEYLGQLVLADKPDNKTLCRTDDRSPLITFDAVSFAYGQSPVLKDVSLEIGAGEFVLLIGQNGSGKSTLFKVLMNLVTPQYGEVKFRGNPVWSTDTSELATEIGYIPQNPDKQLFCATVRDEVGFALENMDLLSAAKIEECVDVALERLQLNELRDRHPLALSRGERARVVMAAVLASDPSVLLFDEPTVGQDYASATALLEEARKLNELGKTVVVVTHHLNLMPGLADRVLVLERGNLRADGPLSEVYGRLGKPPLGGIEPTQSVAMSRWLSDCGINFSAVCASDFRRVRLTNNVG